jgi:hypothetical protein
MTPCDCTCRARDGWTIEKRCPVPPVIMTLATDITTALRYCRAPMMMHPTLQPPRTALIAADARRLVHPHYR